MTFERPQRRALLVEDYLPLRTLVSEALKHAEFDVCSCPSSSEALRTFQPFEFDVLITDIDLPERPNGVELATIMRAQDEGLAVVFLTNFAEGTAFSGTVKPPTPYAFLQKAYLDSTSRLLETVESALLDTEAPIRLTDDGPNSLSGLTTNQLEVVKLIASGLTNSEIARVRGTNVRAVERMIGRLFAQLNLANDSSRNPRVVLSNLYIKTYGFPVRESNT